MDTEDPTLFHIHPDAGVEPEYAVSALHADVPLLRSIGLVTMPTVAGHVALAAGRAQDADRPSAWDRPSDIGLGAQGPYLQWRRLLDAFDAVTTGSAKELVEAGELLAQGADDIARADAGSAERTAALEKALDRGDLEWRNDRVLVPAPHRGGHVLD